MLFTSYEFLFFVLITALLYYTVPKRFQWGLLLVANYVFYALAGLSYLPFILVTTISTYLAGMKLRSMFKAQEDYLSLHKAQMSREERKEYKAKEKKKQWRLLLLCLFINIALMNIIKGKIFAHA